MPYAIEHGEIDITYSKLVRCLAMHGRQNLMKLEKINLWRVAIHSSSQRQVVLLSLDSLKTWHLARGLRVERVVGWFAMSRDV